MRKTAKHKKRTWIPNPAKLLGVIFAFSLLIGLGIAVSSTSNPTRLQTAAKSGCNIVSTKEGPGCWCSDGGWQWHCGGAECTAAQQQSCAAENGSQQVVTKNETAEKSRCKVGEWACGAHCADAATQKIFNSTWKDGKAQWLLEAGCGGIGGAGKKTAAESVVDANDVCSNNSITSLGCQGKTVGTVVGLSGGKSCACTFTSKPDCACVVTSLAPTRVHRGLQRESTSSFLKDAATNLPTRRPDWVKGGYKPIVAKEVGSDAQVNSPTQKCSHNFWTASSCRGETVGTPCKYTKGFITTTIHDGFCQQSGWSGCSCE